MLIFQFDLLTDRNKESSLNQKIELNPKKIRL